MDMDAMEELSAGSNNTIDQTMIMKGKRTKRQRPLSPVGRVVTSSSSSGGGRGGESGCSDDHHYNFSVPSSSEIYASSTTDQEDEEDMAANCLILLAQGRCSGGGGGGGRCCRTKQQEEEEEEIKMEKSISTRKINEMVTTTTATATATAAAAKTGFYVYECKTCNRTFPSFQALGGHRASHKKPKPSTAAEEKKVAGIDAEEGELAEAEESSEEEEKGKQLTIIARAAPNPNPNSNDHYSSQLSMDQISFSNKLVSSHGNNNNNNNKSSKIHECSICGSEFSSGQALGGHMRRHRNPTTTKPTVDHHSGKKPSSSSNTIFPLDLNLPAPEDHDHLDLKFQYATNQQPHLVFSSPALVDCHY